MIAARRFSTRLERPAFRLVITPGACHIVLNKAGGVSQTVIDGANNGALRWQIVLGNNQAEGGGNGGSGFGIVRFSDAGALLDQPIQIARANGVCTFSAAIVNGPSDRSLKENIEPIEGALDKVLALHGVSFDWKEDGRRDIGLIAQDVEPIVPEIIQDFDEERGLKGIDYPKLTALLIEAVKELASELAAVKAQIA